jgi:hypothetical protein
LWIFEATGQLQIIYAAVVAYLRKSGNKIKQCGTLLHGVSK